MPTLPITYPTGKKLAATFTDQSSGQVWRISTSALETFVVANVADYGVVPSESPASSGRYPVATPTDLPTGWYKVDIYLIAGSSLASGDLGSWIGDELGYFDGTKFITATVAPTVVQIRQELDANSTKLANLDAAVSSRSVYAGGTVAGVTNPVTLTSAYDAAKTAAQPGDAMTFDLTQKLSAPRALDSVADTDLTLNDALHCAIADAAGKEATDSNALTYTVRTPYTGTVLRTFTVDSVTAPTVRS